MTTNTQLGLVTMLSAVGLTGGCTGTHVVMDDASRPDAAVVLGDDASVSPDAALSPDAPVPAGEPLESCLLAGGSLVEVARVFNNDVEDHGALLTFGVSDSGLLAAAGEDGTLKFWNLDAELIGTIDGSLLTYGSEVGASPITDLAFRGENALAADRRGLVQEMGPDGSFLPLGGTTPDVPIVALAYHPATDRIAHAQHAEGVVPLTIRAPDGTVTEITPTLTSIHDLAFAPDGSLWVAGGAGAGGLSPTVEQRDAADPARVLRTIEVESPEGGVVVELAMSQSGGAIAMRTMERVEVHFGEGIRSIPFTSWAEVVGAGVALTRPGGVALTVESDGSLVAHAVLEERTLASVNVGGLPVNVRTDASGRLVIVGRADANILAYTCER